MILHSSGDFENRWPATLNSIHQHKEYVLTSIYPSIFTTQWTLVCPFNSLLPTHGNNLFVPIRTFQFAQHKRRNRATETHLVRGFHSPRVTTIYDSISWSITLHFTQRTDGLLFAVLVLLGDRDFVNSCTYRTGSWRRELQTTTNCRDSTGRRETRPEPPENEPYEQLTTTPGRQLEKFINTTATPSLYNKHHVHFYYIDKRNGSIRLLLLSLSWRKLLLKCKIILRNFKIIRNKIYLSD